jgi:hypothetical protein
VPPASDLLENCTGFQWDDANIDKNWERHQVTPEDAEDVFFMSYWWCVAMSGIRNGRNDITPSAKRPLAGGCLLRSQFAKT